MSKCNKLVQKDYESRHDWLRNGINWELCKRLKFYHNNKWYMHKLEAVLKNVIHKIFWDFEIKWLT